MNDISISQIKIEDRKRKDYGDLTSLSDSIKRHGVIEPIVVVKDGDKYRLVAGERRIRASALAGNRTVPIVLRHELDKLTMTEIELEENLYRKDLGWTEQVELRSQIDRLKREKYGSGPRGKVGNVAWTGAKTAESLGISKGTLSEDLKMAKWLQDHPETREALGKLPKRAALRKIVQEEDAIRLRSSMKSQDFKPLDDFLLGDARTLIKAVANESQDMILTDPPYAAEALEGAHKSAKQVLMKETDNLAEGGLLLFSQLSDDLYRVLKPGRHIYVFGSVETCMMFRQMLYESGFVMPKVPLIWSKGTNQTGFTGLNFMRSYEVILWGYKPALSAKIRPLAAPCNDVITYAPLGSLARHHAFEKPPALLKFLINQSSLEYERIFDPFAGVASVHREALRLKRRALSFEIDETHYQRGRDLLEKGI